MIKIVAVSTLKPGVLQDYLQAAAELIEKSNQEEGCISYQIYQDKNDETKVAMFEEWKDEEAIERYLGSGAIRGIGLALVDSIMTALDGTLDLKSTLGRGTVVTLGLPLYKR